MVRSMQSSSPVNRKSGLARWLNTSLGQRRSQVKFRIQGNHLHVLCEGDPCPHARTLQVRLLYALQRTDLNTLIPKSDPPIYQVFLYGRASGDPTPRWRFPIYLNQIDRHLELLQRQANEEDTIALDPSAAHSESSGHNGAIATAEFSGAEGETGSPSGLATMPRLDPEHSVASIPTDADSSTTGTAALVLSNWSLARRGDRQAIARYLSETLSKYGIAVKVQIKQRSQLAANTQSTEHPINLHGLHDLRPKRLWLICDGSYSPDPALIAEPIAQQLRELELDEIGDAIALMQVRGESQPDWILRVDLTPPHEILKEWARWGDVEALTRLMNESLNNIGVELATTTLKQSTLHLACRYQRPALVGAGVEADGDPIPDLATVKSVLLPLLESIAPQGVHGTMLYGQIRSNDASPAWVEWLELPGAIHPALADPPLDLAQQQDWQALNFLLTRLLNPGLDHYLATGGIRIQILPKGDLLHIMTDAPVCPSQQQVGKAIAKFLKSLRIGGIAGVRIYGRRAGQKRPTWSYGKDFIPRQRLVAEPTPEFAATDAYVGDLVSRTPDPILRPELTPEDLRRTGEQLWQTALQKVQQGLVRSHLFTLSADNASLVPVDADEDVSESDNPAYTFATALIWVTVGLLVTLQVNWGFDRWLQQTEAEPTTAATLPAPQVTPAPSPQAEQPQGDRPRPSNQTDLPIDETLLNPSADTDADAFEGSGFTELPPVPLSPSSDPLPNLPPLPRGGSEDFLSADPELATSGAAPILWSIESPLPTFNSDQLDQKLALYYALLEESGPPDVLIVGSSRALRGVDPAVLRHELAQLGYEDLTIFNFGINGATAQVVELVVNRILLPGQLPDLIIWADGARAMNSGRVDVTYNGIALSEGYRQLMAGTLDRPQFTDEVVEEPAPSPTAGNISTTLSNSYDALDRRLSEQLAQQFSIFTERDRLKHGLQNQWMTLSPAADLPTPPTMTSPELADPADPTAPANPDTAGDAMPLQTQGVITYDGFLPLELQFNPATYYQQYARVSGSYDRDYEDFRLQGRQTEALNTIIQLTETQNIDLVVVNLPLTDDYLDTVRRQHEQTFREQLLATSVQHDHVLFRDLGEAWLSEYDYFSDPSHLNRYGAYAVSNRLAQDPLISWPISVDPSEEN